MTTNAKQLLLIRDILDKDIHLEHFFLLIMIKISGEKSYAIFKRQSALENLAKEVGK